MVNAKYTILVLIMGFNAGNSHSIINVSSQLWVQVTQSKSRWNKRSEHSKFNCITVNFENTQHGIYVMQTSITRKCRSEE